jgi:hypothetical protein
MLFLMADCPRKTTRGSGLPGARSGVGCGRGPALDETGLVPALFVPVTPDAFAASDERHPRNAQNASGRLIARGTACRKGELRDRTMQLEDAVAGTLVFVEGHGAPQVTDARS